MVDEVYKISHRDYCTGFFFGSPRDDAQIYYKGGYVRSWEVAAIAVKSENGTLTVSQRNRFFEGDELEIMNRGKEPTVITVRNLKIPSERASTMPRIPCRSSLLTAMPMFRRARLSAETPTKNKT